MHIIQAVIRLEDITEGLETPNFSYTLTDIDATETPKLITWKGNRLKKEELHQIEKGYENVKMMVFKSYTTEEHLEEVKEKLKAALIEQVLYYDNQIQRFKRALETEPAVKRKEWI